MTPPSAKPLSDATDESEIAETEVSPNVEGDASAVSGRTPAGRRRAASLELRVANRRLAAANEEGDAPAKTGKATTRPSRVQANGGVRNGPRAQQRAAKAALAESHLDDAPLDEATDRLLPDDVAPEAEWADDADRFATEHPEVDEWQDDVSDDTPGSVSQPDSADLPATADLTDTAVAMSVPAAPRRLEPAPQTEPNPDDLLPEEDDGQDDERGPGGGGRRRNGPRAERRAARAAKSNDAANYVVAPTVNMAEMRPRHYGVIALFALMVILPTLSYSWYLWTKAVDQYESNVGFGSRTEDAPATFDFLGALGGMSQNGSKDMDILYQYIVSQELVGKIDKELDLRTMFAKASNDPLNAFKKGGTIEDLLAYWQRMVKVNYDNGTGLMTLRVFAFEPADAQKIAEMILVESTKIINDLSMTAQVDTTRYSKDAMTAAEQKLTEARLAVLDYQIKNGIVDPSTSIASQNGIIGNLNTQLASTQVELDMLTGTVNPNDVRIATLNRKIEVILNRIAIETAKVGGAADSTSPGFAKLMQEFQRLKVDEDFAQRAYLSALAAYDQAVTDAQHKTRYLATYVAPTLAEASTAPNRPLSALLVAVIGFLLWSISVLMYYALRDRR